MAVRVTATEVKAIMEDNISRSDAQVDAYIVGANALVNEVLGTGESDLLTTIEKFLSAHIIASTTDRMAVKEGAGGAYIEYTGKYGQGLDSTSYGQMVKMLDTTCAFAELGLQQTQFIAIKSFD